MKDGEVVRMTGRRGERGSEKDGEEGERGSEEED
jgi:hypothetical protein